MVVGRHGGLPPAAATRSVPPQSVRRRGPWAAAAAARRAPRHPAPRSRRRDCESRWRRRRWCAARSADSTRPLYSTRSPSMGALPQQIMKVDPEGCRSCRWLGRLSPSSLSGCSTLRYPLSLRFDPCPGAPTRVRRLGPVERVDRRNAFFRMACRRVPTATISLLISASISSTWSRMRSRIATVSCCSSSEQYGNGYSISLGAAYIRLIDTVSLHAVAVLASNVRVEEEVQILTIDNRLYVVDANDVTSKNRWPGICVYRGLAD